jgi:hypothetical protein
MLARKMMMMKGKVRRMFCEMLSKEVIYCITLKHLS